MRNILYIYIYIYTYNLIFTISLQIQEKKGNLFNCPNNLSLAHCVSEDLVMGKGIAVTFKKTFGGIKTLKRQGTNPSLTSIYALSHKHFIIYRISPSNHSLLFLPGAKTGEIAYLKRKERYIYYLVTKKQYFHKPTYASLQSSLQAMKRHCVKHNISNIAMPKIGCGLDKLEWRIVKKMLTKLFKKTNIHITVYSI